MSRMDRDRPAISCYDDNDRTSVREGESTCVTTAAHWDVAIVASVQHARLLQLTLAIDASIRTSKWRNDCVCLCQSSATRMCFATCGAQTRVASAAVETDLADRDSVAAPIQLTEQRAIAEALSDVDGLLGGLDRLIAKKRDLKQAAMQQLLTGQTRLPGFHGEWEVKRLARLLILMGQSASAQQCSSDWS